MPRIKFIFSSLALIIALTTLPTQSTTAQCPMCKMSLESNLKNGGSAGRGMNKGIFMILVMPYLLVGSIGIIWYRNRKRNFDAEQRPDDEQKTAMN